MPDLILNERPDNTSIIIITAISLILVILISFIKNFYKDFYQKLFRVSFRLNKSNTNFIDSVVLNNQAILISLSIAILSISTAIYTTVSFYKVKPQVYDENNFTMFFIVLAIVGGYLIFKNISIVILGKIFEQNNLAKQNINYATCLIQITGIILLPVYILIPFTETLLSNFFMTTTILIIIVSQIYFYFLFFFNLIKQKMLNFYTILYFCIFEVLPILFLYEMVL